MAEVLNVSERKEAGSGAARRLRRSGQIPAVLYGHGEESVTLSAAEREVAALLRHHTTFVDLKGAVKDTAVIREVQMDAFGAEVLHLDLQRVSATESVETNVRIEVHGEAPGASEGGVLEQISHEVNISCPARGIPESIEVSVNEMHLGDVITLGDLELPKGAELLDDPNEPAVQCLEPVEPAAPEEEVAEPEVVEHPEGEAGEEEATEEEGAKAEEEG